MNLGTVLASLCYIDAMAESQNKQLIDLLEREFDRLREREGQDKYRTINDMATFLDIQASTLSHYRTAKRLLGRNAARDFADQLRSDERGGNAKEREELAAALYSARPSKPGEREVQDWLKSMGDAKNLLLVEFRQLPAARPSGPSPSLASDVGQAIASGLSYGLLLPYPENFAELSNVQEEQKAFVGLIKKNVIETYRAILIEAIDDAFRSGKRGKEELKEIASRLQVYILERDDTWNDPCPGIGHKLYLHHGYDKEIQAWQSRIWQWISQSTSHRLIKHDPSEVEIDAIESELYPLLAYFRENEHLPSSQQLQEYIENAISVPDHYPRWKQLDAMSEDAIDKHIKKRQGDPKENRGKVN